MSREDNAQRKRDGIKAALEAKHFPEPREAHVTRAKLDRLFNYVDVDASNFSTGENDHWDIVRRSYAELAELVR
jgi:hypothetical protein